VTIGELLIGLLGLIFITDHIVIVCDVFKIIKGDD